MLDLLNLFTEGGRPPQEILIPPWHSHLVILFLLFNNLVMLSI